MTDSKSVPSESIEGDANTVIISIDNESNKDDEENKNESKHRDESNCVPLDKDDLLQSERRRNEVLADGMVKLQTNNDELKEEIEILKMQLDKLQKKLHETEMNLSHANTDIMNLKQENGLLRTNLKEYQKSLDECEMIQEMYQKGNLGPPAQSKSPQTSPNWSKLRKSRKTIKKKNISAPERESVIHISGAKMIGTEMTVVDNTGLLDPRVRKFLAIAGLDGDQIVNSPEKLAVVEKFANEENIQKVMKEREERKKKKKKEEKTMKAFSPPPPPPPAPPVASSTTVKLPTKAKKTDSLAVPERSVNKDAMDWREAITSGSVRLKPVPIKDKENHKNEVQKASDGEILSLLKTALHNINEVSGVSSDEDEKNDKDDDW